MKSSEYRKGVSSGRSENHGLGCSGNSASRLCPSFPPHMKGQPFAYRNADGILQFCDETFDEGLCRPESVRYSGHCVTVRCINGSGRCNLGAMLAQSVSISVGRRPSEEPATNSCPIKASCRWISENGEQACSACVSVDHLVAS